MDVGVINNAIIVSQKQPTKRLGTHCKYGHELKDPNLYYNKTQRICKLCTLQYRKNFVARHPELIKRKTKIYYHKHKAELLKATAVYYLENKQEIKQNKAVWYQENKERILKQQKKYRNRMIIKMVDLNPV